MTLYSFSPFGCSLPFWVESWFNGRMTTLSLVSVERMFCLLRAILSVWWRRCGQRKTQLHENVEGFCRFQGSYQDKLIKHIIWMAAMFFPWDKSRLLLTLRSGDRQYVLISAVRSESEIPPWLLHFSYRLQQTQESVTDPACFALSLLKGPESHYSRIFCPCN